MRKTHIFQAFSECVNFIVLNVLKFQHGGFTTLRNNSSSFHDKHLGMRNSRSSSYLIYVLKFYTILFGTKVLSQRTY